MPKSFFIGNVGVFVRLSLPAALDKGRNGLFQTLNPSVAAADSPEDSFLSVPAGQGKKAFWANKT